MTKTIYEHIAFLRRHANRFDRQVLDTIDAIEREVRRMEEQSDFPLTSFHEEPVSGVCTRHQYRPDEDGEQNG